MDRAEILIYPEYRAHLDDLAGVEHVWVLMWMDRAERDRLQVHPRGDTSLPRRHVFATRSPARPNPIGLCLVDVVLVRPSEGVLAVSGLDALDGTPVIDLKPYVAKIDQP